MSAILALTRSLTSRAVGVGGAALAAGGVEAGGAAGAAGAAGAGSAAAGGATAAAAGASLLLTDPARVFILFCKSYKSCSSLMGTWVNVKEKLTITSFKSSRKKFVKTWIERDVFIFQTLPG